MPRDDAPVGEQDRQGERIEATAFARGVVAACALGAAAIHFGFAPDHFGESRFHGAFFFLAGWAQLAFALAVILRPTRAVMRVGIALNGAIVLLWFVSRTVGMPFGDEPWVAEAVNFPDVLATVLELGAITGSYLLLTGRLSRRALPRAMVTVGGVALVIALVGLTTASVAPALSGGHSHGADESAVGHAHAGTEAEAGAGVAAAAGAAGHTHTSGAPAAAGIEAATGSSPCEQSGVAVEGNSAGHGHRGPSPQQPIADAATRALLADQLTQARAAAARFPTAADGIAAGYRRITGYVPCIGAHYMNFALADGAFDAAKPEMLLFDGNGSDARIVGLSYYVRGVTAALEGFAGPNDPWHQHIGLCVSGGAVIGGTNLTAAECAARGGVKADGSDAFMMHAWVVPGWESAWGTFSGEHPELGKTVAR